MPTAPDSAELVRPAERGGRMSEIDQVEEVQLRRRPVLASGCGAVSTFLAEEPRPDTGGIHAAGSVTMDHRLPGGS